MPRHAFLILVWESVKTIQSYGALGLFFAFLAWIYSPEQLISLRYVAPIVIILALGILIFWNLALALYTSDNKNLPKVLLSKNKHDILEGLVDPLVLCVLDSSVLYSHEMLVSFYAIEDGFEEFLGIGEVINIQEDGKIQVIFSNPIRDIPDVLKRLGNNDATMLKKIMVKPSIPKTYFKLFLEGTNGK